MKSDEKAGYHTSLLQCTLQTVNHCYCIVRSPRFFNYPGMQWAYRVHLHSCTAISLIQKGYQDGTTLTKKNILCDGLFGWDTCVVNINFVDYGWQNETWCVLTPSKLLLRLALPAAVLSACYTVSAFVEPTNSYSQTILGGKAMSNGLMNLATDIFDKAIELDPLSSLPRVLKALIMV